MQDFLKALYLKEVIESPSYWAKHYKLFNTNSMKAALEREATNKYFSIINDISESFRSSQKGEKAFDFTAHAPDGSSLKLSDLKGKLVVIDTWATWCGPCLKHRPYMLKIAEKYHDNPKVEILMISVDSSTKRWESYINKTNKINYGTEVIIPEGMQSDFGNKYAIKSIPKYILIDENGIILNSDLPEPSLGMEKIIEQEIANGNKSTSI